MRKRGGKHTEVRKSPSPSWSRSVFSRLGSKERRRKERRRRSLSQASSRSVRVFSRLGVRRYEPFESKDSAGGRHWKKLSRRTQKGTKDDLSEPYDEESTTPFTWRIYEFDPLGRGLMSCNQKALTTLRLKKEVSSLLSLAEKIHQRPNGASPREAERRGVHIRFHGTFH
ncbi:hypothetical protein Tco_0535433 [Tanacetum coccineum]